MVHFIWACKKIKEQFVKNTLSIYASNVVFFIMLSFFPFAMFFFTILKYIPGITQGNLIPMIGSLIPGELGETLVSWIQEAYHHSSGTVLSISALTALWAGSKGFMGITYGLNRIAGTEQRGNWFFNRFVSFLYTLIFAAMLVLSLSVIVFGNQILLIIDSFFSIDTPLFIGIFSLRSIAGFAIFFCYFLLMYTFVPYHDERPRLRNYVSGALFTSITWILFSNLYSVYIDSFSNYSSLYGSFTSIALFMLWLYVCVTLLFIGALINQFHLDGYSLFSRKAKNKIKNQFETLKESILPENNDK